MKQATPHVLGVLAGLVPRRAALSLYRSTRLAYALRSTLNLLVPEGLSEVSIVHGPLAGRRMELNLKLEKFLWLGTYEPWVEDTIARHLRPGMYAWDVGAFIGYHTLLLRRLAGPGRVLAIEPDPVNRGRLERNLALNGYSDVTVVASAAGRRDGPAQLLRASANPSETRVSHSDVGDSRMIALDGLAAHMPDPALIKVDVEGGEADVLMGARQLLEVIRPIWIVELHGPGGERAVNLLRAAHYDIRPIGKGFDVSTQLPVGGPAHVVALPR